MNVRTTVILPEDLLETAKATAFYRRLTLSHLIKEGLENVIRGESGKKGKSLDFNDFLGKRSLKIKEIKREKIYESYLRKKVSS